MIKGIAIFFGLFLGLMALLFWAKMTPAQATPLIITVPKISPPEAPDPAFAASLTA